MSRKSIFLLLIGPKAKSEFFYKLVTTLPGFRLENVTNLKVDSKTETPVYDSTDQVSLGR